MRWTQLGTSLRSLGTGIIINFSQLKEFFIANKGKYPKHKKIALDKFIKVEYNYINS